MRSTNTPAWLGAVALLLTTCTYATAIPERRATSSAAVAYYPPAQNGGSMLTYTYGSGGEPINMILSGLSSASVLTPAGFLNYAQSLNFSGECLGGHLGGYQAANLGDGAGLHNQTGIYRYDFGDPVIGTCTESIDGGNHFRFWVQNGTSANSGAYFIAASVEMSADNQHNIVSNGYNLGRDNILASAKQMNSTAYNGVVYTTRVQMVSGLESSGSAGINHGISIDGQVAVLTVTAVNTTSSAAAQSTNPSNHARTSIQLFCQPMLYSLLVFSVLLASVLV